MLKAKMVRARSKGDLTVMEDHVRRLGIRVDSAKGIAAGEYEMETRVVQNATSVYMAINACYLNTIAAIL